MGLDILEYRKLGHLHVSVIGLGTLRVFDVTDEADLILRRQIIENLLSNGINFIYSCIIYRFLRWNVG